jgi:hypothetical protein
MMQTACCGLTNIVYLFHTFDYVYDGNFFFKIFDNGSVTMWNIKLKIPDFNYL